MLGAIFDIDGVVVDSPHEQAWREALRDLMEGPWSELRDRTTWSPEAFTGAVYREHVSGRPRLSGARAALQHFGVPDVGPRAEAYAARKQETVLRLIDAGAVRPYPDAVRLLLALRDAGLRLAAASSSRNADRILRGIEAAAVVAGAPAGSTLLDLFDADVSGRPVPRGKPHPDLFLLAAQELGLAPEHAVVVEDAPAGVQAAKAGGMAAIGVARAADHDLLAGAGADLVVDALDDVDVSALAQGRLATRSR